MQRNDSRRSSQVRFHRVTVRGVEIFYREAGDPSLPTLLLLHGFPASSHSFRDLIPLLADRFHVVAPDYPGAGNSAAPTADVFRPTFDDLASLMEDFVRTLGFLHFTIYMHDFGGPVGFRMAVKHPEWIDALVIQNANAYVESIAPELLEGIRARSGGRQTPEALASTDAAFGRATTIFYYTHGARDPKALSPDAWNMDEWVLSNPEAMRIQRALIVDYASNLEEYPRWQRYLREHTPRTLVVWGKNDPLFLPSGAEAYKREVPGAELRFYDTGHFALEEDAGPIAEAIRGFLT